MNPANLSPLANHLWQSTLFAGIAWLLTAVLRNNRARVRHWVWLVASWKFLIPFSVLTALGSQVHWRTAPHALQPGLSVVMDEVSQPFTVRAASRAPTPVTLPADSPTPAVLWTIWACGFLGLGRRWWIRWRHIRAAVRAGSPLHLEAPIRAVSSPTLLEPGVFGVFRPVMLLPEGILNRLTPAQLKCVIAHEMSHVYHRDNLIASIHMFVETALWFHPLVWWIGRRMVEERERACDEEVLRLGSEPRAYAEGILEICRLYMESPLVCVAGVTGANLKKRIHKIMSGRHPLKLNFGRKLLLVLSGIAALAAPFSVGLFSITAPAQPAAANAFEVASVKLADPKATLPGAKQGGPQPMMAFRIDQSRFQYTGSLFGLIVKAYGLPGCTASIRRGENCALLAGGPDWLRKERFLIQAKLPEGTPDYTRAQVMNGEAPMLQAMIRTLLSDRFSLKVHRQQKDLAVYALTVGRSGPKLKKADETKPSLIVFRPAVRENSEGTIQLAVTNTALTELVNTLSDVLARPVIDRTGIGGKFDFTLEYDPNTDSPDPVSQLADPSLFAAFQRELGLRFEATKAPVSILVIDQIEMPPVN